MEAILVIALFLSVCACLLAGFPAAFTLAGVSLLFAIIAAALGLFSLSFLLAWPSRIFGTMTNATLFAVPLFILMGLILERSHIARDLLHAISDLLGRKPGGIALAVTLVSSLLAASTGIVGATVVTMGLLALPIMMERQYNPQFATGTIAATGTLGVIIPPSILLVLLGDTLASAYATAQRASGNYAPDTISVGDLFAGALFPGLTLAALYFIYQFVYAQLNPHKAPSANPSNHHKSMTHLLRMLIAPILLIIAVLGSILAGIATPTESAAVGTIGACLIAAERIPAARIPFIIACGLLLILISLKLFLPFQLTAFSSLSILGGLLLAAFFVCLTLICYHLWREDILSPAIQSTTRMTAMVFAILICASLFSLVFRGLGGDELVHNALENLPGGKWSAFLITMLVIFLLGFILDFIEITFIVVPIVAPILMILGFDPIWLGVMIAINLQTSFLTPPFGFALFYLRGVAPAAIETRSIYQGVAPFIIIQIVGLILVGLFPQTASWLPQYLFR